VNSSYQRLGAAFYAQDNWRVSRRLVLNLGVRLEPAFSPFPKNHYNAWIRSGVQSQVFPNAPPGIVYFADPNTPGANSFTRWNQAAPRFGFAWDPRGNGKWSIRGGFGVYFSELAEGQTLENSGGGIAPFPSGSITITNPASLTYPWDSSPYNGKIAIPIPSPTASTTILRPIAPGNGLHDPDSKAPKILTWSTTFERSVGANLLLRAGYVGSRGMHLAGGENFNLPVFIPGASTAQNVQQRRPDQNFGAVWIASANQNSFYNSMQLGVEKRYSHGLSLLANYTLSKSTDEGSTPVGWGFGTQDPRGPHFNRGLSDFDRTHIVNASAVYDLPKMSGANPFVRRVLGNW